MPQYGIRDDQETPQPAPAAFGNSAPQTSAAGAGKPQSAFAPVSSMSDPGYGESAYTSLGPQLQNGSYNQNGQNYLNAFASSANPVSDYWNGVAGQFSQPKDLQGNFDAAYGHATQQAIGNANAQAASRGVYGSSAALNNVDSVAAQMAANQANAQNQFTLQNSANQLNYLTAGGNLANNAQSSDQSKAALLIGQEMGLSADQINRLIATMNAGNSAQNAFQGRESQSFNQADQYSQQAMQALQNYFGSLQSAANPSSGNAATAGATQNAVNDQGNQTAQGNQSLNQMAQIIASMYGLGKSPSVPATTPIPSVTAPTYGS